MKTVGLSALLVCLTAIGCSSRGQTGGEDAAAGGGRGGSTAGASGGIGAGGGMSGTGGATGIAGATATGGASGGVGGVGGIGGIGGVGGVGAAAGGRGGTTGAAGGGGGRGGAATGGAGGTGGSGKGGGAGTGTGGATGQGGGGASGHSGNSGGAGAGGAVAVLAATPPMGWNSWNTFECNISETLIKAVADAFVSSGMQAAGYQYVNLDDCWMDGRDASGNLQWNATKFPSGIPALATYIHGKGLKIGIYETPNTETCVGIYGGISPTVAVGSLGHEAQDAKTFASWGIDYLKYDLCKGDRNSFATMRDALRATGRSIVYSINPGNGADDVCPPDTCSLNLPTIANLWRIGFDINASWASVTSLIDQDAPLYSYAGPGHWNDPDMLEVGNGLAANEDRAHFSMWSMLAAPLIAGNDVRSMTSATTAVLTNAEVIAIDQDPLGAQGRLVATPATNLQVWSKTLSGSNSRAVVLLNRNGASASITVAWSALGLAAGGATVRDLWSHTDLGTFANSYTAAAIPSHGVAMLKIMGSP